MWKTWTVLGLVVVLLSSCGTTVQTRETAGESLGTQQGGLTGPQAAGSAGLPPTGGVSAGGTAGSGGAPPGSQGGGAYSGPAGSGPVPARGSARAGSSSQGTGAVGGQVVGRGVTKTTVYIGVGKGDLDAYANAVGLKGVSMGDTDAQNRAVLKEIARRGGLGGRKIELVVHEFNTAQLVSDPATANQAACEDWTRDHQVFAVLWLTDSTLLSCLKKTNTPLIDAGAGWDLSGMRIYKNYFTDNPNYFLIGAMLGDRYESLATARMVARNYFQQWDTTAGRPGNAPMKLGLVMPDVPAGRLCVQLLSKELAKHGIKPARVYMTNGQGATQESAVLRFRADGITHVIGASLRFMNGADSQHYYPRYFIRIAVDTIAQNAPASQLSGAMAESLIPANDVGAAEDPGDPTPATTQCKRIMRAAGQSYTERSVLWTMLSLCDSFFFLKDAIDASGSLTTAGLRSGMESLGSRPSANTWVHRLGPGEHAGGRAMRDISFHAECHCFTYDGTRNYQ